jgi:hypothetical protein
MSAEQMDAASSNYFGGDERVRDTHPEKMATPKSRRPYRPSLLR